MDDVRFVRSLSHMEQCVLAVVWMLQPCTGYAVRKVFLESFSSAYSGSAGAIYPLLTRMLKNGQLQSEPTQTGKRKASLYSLTEQGMGSLVDWLQERPIPEATVEVDPVRIKLRFFGALPRQKRGAVIDALLEQMQRSQHTIRAREEDSEGQFAQDPFFHEAMRYAIHTQQARIDWLRANRERFMQLD